MGLSTDLISEFAKITKSEPKTNKETIVYGKAIKSDGVTYVQIDGSDRWTPVESTSAIKAENEADAERVTVVVKDHSATIIGNASFPAARDEDVQEHGNRIDEFDIIVSYKVTTDDLTAINATIQNLIAIVGKYENLSAVVATIETLNAKFAELEHVSADDVKAILAEVETIRATIGEFTDISTDDLDAANAEIDNLTGHTANFTYLSTEELRAYKADIEELKTRKLNADFANVDYANIDQATFQEFYAKSGMVEYVTADGVSVTGYLVGVKIKGDYIEAGTLVAEALIVKGADGLFYKLNAEAGTFTEEQEIPTDGLHGTVIVAKSVTAEKVDVSELAAFEATIGGFHITGADEEAGTPGAIYSGAKATPDATNIPGIHLSADGQLILGDNDNYFKYYKDENGEFRLALAAESIFFGVGKNFTLDDNGMTIEGETDDTNTKIKTVVSNNGMSVHNDSKADEEDPTVLIANDKGVVATDLHARTYMIVGKNSRFEDYGDDRTGCFWIGE